MVYTKSDPQLAGNAPGPHAPGSVAPNLRALAQPGPRNASPSVHFSVSETQADLTAAIARLEAIRDAKSPSGKGLVIGKTYTQPEGICALRTVLNRLHDQSPFMKSRLDENFGSFNGTLRAAVRAYQESRGLTPDGDPGPLTLGRLIEDCRALVRAPVAPARSAQPPAAPAQSAQPPRQEAPRVQSDVGFAKEVLRMLPEQERVALTAKLRCASSCAKLGEAGVFADWLRRCGVSPSAPVTRAAASEAYKTITVAWYRGMVRSARHELDERPGQLTVVGMRGFDISSGPHDNRFTGPAGKCGNSYNDTMAFIRFGRDGRVELCKEVRYTADPGFRYGVGEDVNGDGVKDPAHLMAGRHEYVPGTHKGIWGAARPRGDRVLCARDLNCDGGIDASEMAFAKQHGLVGIALNIHARKGSGSMVGTDSAGCQVLDMPWDQFHREISPILGSDPLFPLILLNVSSKPRR